MVTPRADWLALCAIVVLAACQPAPTPPSSATTGLDPDAARDRVAEALGDAGVGVERTADGLRATTRSASFVECLPVTLTVDDGRQVFTQVRERHGVVDIRFAGNDRTTASWQTSFTGRYMNRVNNMPFERECDSTGRLEALIARALAA